VLHGPHGLAPGPLGDLVGDGAGNLYVDDVGYAAHKGEPPWPGRLLRIGADGRVTIAADELGFPNSPAIVDDDATRPLALARGLRL
jgi:sugar lactone lactonase YvrE